MLAFNHEALRVQLAADFISLSSSVRDAAQVSHIFRALARTAVAILCEFTQTWSASNDRLWHMPDEALALCFTFLPFSGRITVSHVSRRWRRIAIAHPAIWAHLDMGRISPRQLHLVHMALSRSGSHPVDLRLLVDADPNGILKNNLKHHMHHLRAVEGDLPWHIVPLSISAPFIETLSGLDYHAEIPSGLLASLCHPKSAETFRRLFYLFPTPQSLHLNGLQKAFARFLPQGPAPASLSSLTLEGVDPGYDVTPHYNNWRTDSLRYVSLQQEEIFAAHLDQLLSGARRLTVRVDYNLETSGIIAQCPGGRAHSITFTDEDNIARTAEVVLSAASALQRVHYEPGEHRSTDARTLVRAAVDRSSYFRATPSDAEFVFPVL
ncbi:hypothetical protein AURDEDRAFT_171235 [Auricularia subglabra TFB-10046 SS5]|uniref:F-box domain-containing protein n=1 Tax=Auricularia subglabra (strain TFB-10046 / SS5) TaxID=717982 RepID=J0LJ95_AURST|nr:hypothetical protein AURDEDRAFT_171235 [Auricularia subglabra TFB-10046 SS5]